MDIRASRVLSSVAQTCGEASREGRPVQSLHRRSIGSRPSSLSRDQGAGASECTASRLPASDWTCGRSCSAPASPSAAASASAPLMGELIAIGLDSPVKLGRLSQSGVHIGSRKLVLPSQPKTKTRREVLIGGRIGKADRTQTDHLKLRLRTQEASYPRVSLP